MICGSECGRLIPSIGLRSQNYKSLCAAVNFYRLKAFTIDRPVDLIPVRIHFQAYFPETDTVLPFLATYVYECNRQYHLAVIAKDQHLRLGQSIAVQFISSMIALWGISCIIG